MNKQISVTSLPLLWKHISFTVLWLLFRICLRGQILRKIFFYFLSLILMSSFPNLIDLIGPIDTGMMDCIFKLFKSFAMTPLVFSHSAPWWIIFAKISWQISYGFQNYGNFISQEHIHPCLIICKKFKSIYKYRLYDKKSHKNYHNVFILLILLL